MWLEIDNVCIYTLSYTEMSLGTFYLLFILFIYFFKNSKVYVFKYSFLIILSDAWMQKNSLLSEQVSSSVSRLAKSPTDLSWKLELKRSLILPGKH